MTRLIAFDIYRTVNVSVNGRPLVARFLRSKDHEVFELLLSDEESGQIWKCSYSAETAIDFAKEAGESLEQHVYEILKGDVANGIDHPLD